MIYQCVRMTYTKKVTFTKIPVAQLGPQQTSKMESFAAIANIANVANVATAAIVAKLSISDACGAPGYVSENIYQ